MVYIFRERKKNIYSYAVLGIQEKTSKNDTSCQKNYFRLLLLGNKGL